MKGAIDAVAARAIRDSLRVIKVGTQEPLSLIEAWLAPLWEETRHGQR